MIARKQLDHLSKSTSDIKYKKKLCSKLFKINHYQAKDYCSTIYLKQILQKFYSL